MPRIHSLTAQSDPCLLYGHPNPCKPTEPLNRDHDLSNGHPAKHPASVWQPDLVKELRSPAGSLPPIPCLVPPPFPGPGPPAGACLLWRGFYGQHRRPACTGRQQPPFLRPAWFMGSVMSQRFKQPLVGAAGLGLQPGEWPPRSQALITLPVWALLLAVYLQGGCLTRRQAPVGVLGSRWGAGQGDQRWFKAAG